MRTLALCAVTIVAATFAGGFCARHARAASNTVTINNPAVYSGETAAQCYHDADEHLVRGMWFERAAEQLQAAIRQDPKNADYHLALGCAYADRAASIGYAEAYAVMHAGETAQYPKDLADWQEAQSDPANYLYHTDQPVPPPAFVAYTKDDLKPFTLTTDQADARLAELAKEAQAEWAQGIALETGDAGRANAEYFQGWGLSLLAEYRFGGKDLGDYETGSPSSAVAGMPSDDDAARAFTAATKDDPGNAVYWQSLGDALGPPDARPVDLSDASASHQNPATHGELALAAYRHALSLDPKNALLWWYIAQFEVARDPKAAEDDLRQATDADPTNAFPFYVLAQAELKQTHYINNHRENSDIDQKDLAATERIDRQMAATLTDDDRNLAADAVQLVEQGNEAPFCGYPIYYPPVPPMLAAANDYLFHATVLFPAYAQQRALARDLCGYADARALQGDLTTAFDVDVDVVAMGKRVIGDWSMQEDWKAGHVLIGELVGIAIASIGYQDLERIAVNYADPGTLEAVQEEADQFKDEQTQWKQVLRQEDVAETNMYANY